MPYLLPWMGPVSLRGLSHPVLSHPLGREDCGDRTQASATVLVCIERGYRQGGQGHYSPQGHLGPIWGSLLGRTLVLLVPEESWLNEPPTQAQPMTRGCFSGQAVVSHSRGWLWGTASRAWGAPPHGVTALESRGRSHRTGHRVLRMNSRGPSRHLGAQGKRSFLPLGPRHLLPRLLLSSELPL